MLIAAPAEVGFQNYLLRPFTYLTAGAVRLHNNTFIPHCTNWAGAELSNSIFVGAKNDA